MHRGPLCEFAQIVSEFDPAVDRSIDVHLSKVRAALTAAHPAGAGLIRTLRGVGYMLVAADTKGQEP